MDPTLKQKWLTALRSGKYKQGTRNLCKVNKEGEKSYCCLGVLTEVVCGEDYWTERRGAGGRVIMCNAANYSGYPTYIQMEEWGIDSAGNDARGELLVDMNDGNGKFAGNPQTFDQIADHIEENL